MNNWLYTYTLEGKCYDADRTEYEVQVFWGLTLTISRSFPK